MEICRAMSIWDIISLPRDLQGPNKKLRLRPGEDSRKPVGRTIKRQGLNSAYYLASWRQGWALASSTKDSGYALVLTLARTCSYPQIPGGATPRSKRSNPQESDCFCFLAEMAKQPQEHRPFHRSTAPCTPELGGFPHLGCSLQG